MAVRGRLRFMRGQRDAAIADLRAAGEIFTALEFRNPLAAPWRSPLALALGAENAEEARALADDELRDATELGLARCRGVALRTAGCLEGGSRGMELLEESLRVLDHTDAHLERARTLVELGAAQRRANQRVVARDPLRAGLDLAHRCGAERLAERAVEELQLCGARPRRRVLSGPEALTPGEARVARMAAAGMTNREIAQDLFVTAKTVENQLGAVYSKLGVRSRAQLSAALDVTS
jgi:DNA-binding CsgD family transcriptional regulator